MRSISSKFRRSVYDITYIYYKAPQAHLRNFFILDTCDLTRIDARLNSEGSCNRADDQQLDYAIENYAYCTL